ncbi:BREX system P-loop protein BrxC [Rhodovibrio salinarum]|uniref:BREX system P-loop protein BrxC n=1 Tax=Rhodovibrio salinarum TaxID=1087 RepID=A0A934QJY4_9PROT|nr:BREX system P-loop protein BrxC [Rhodovibrio salinarum]MBK1698287.1 hypothetical protein [Rhodovibrio salinarum]
MTELKDVLERDPTQQRLANNGQARLVAEESHQQVQQELREELKSFVCEGQYKDGIIRILQSVVNGGTNLPCAWVSGFYGSGKSHLMKMLWHFWLNTEFDDGQTARDLVPELPEDVSVLLREVDTLGKRTGGLVAAAGSMPSGDTEAVRITVLSIIFQGAGLPVEYAQGSFYLWLHRKGKLEAIKSAVASRGEDFDQELEDLYASPVLAEAIAEEMPDVAGSAQEARSLIRTKFPRPKGDITTQEFLDLSRAALKSAGRDGQIPQTLVVLDEVQQYIGESQDRSVQISEVAEALSKQMQGRVMLVGAGQTALNAAPNLQRLIARFTVLVALRDVDVEKVTRKVLLRKKASAVGEVRQVLDTYAAEVSRQLSGTKIKERVEDRETIVDDYPVLPVRRRFFEECFRQLDETGTRAQLRSQLSILHTALYKRADRQLGVVIPADELYDALASVLVSTGVLLRDIDERIKKARQEDGELAGRICAVVFLINSLRRDEGLDIGVRANKEHIADLLVDDLSADNGKLRSDVAETLEKLKNGGTLMPMQDEYRLQTREGAEWDREFRQHSGAINSDPTERIEERHRRIYAAFDQHLRKVEQGMRHGASKLQRRLVLHTREEPPEETDAIPVWARDGWNVQEAKVRDDARSAGNDSPTVFAFIPRHHVESLKEAIATKLAAQKTLDRKGHPTTAEGQDARKSMESRRDTADREAGRLISEIVGNTQIFQGGGNEIHGLSLHEQIEQAAEDSLDRKYPRFKEADSAHWDKAFKRAREGADNPLEPVGHTGDVDRHSVCQEVLTTVGAGKAGTEIRRQLQAEPLGWPREAIDTALLALLRREFLTAWLNHEVATPNQLDHTKIAKAVFYRTSVTLGMKDKLALVKFFQRVGVECDRDTLVAHSGNFLEEVRRRAKEAGGDPPLPKPLDARIVDDLERLSGNERLAEILNKSQELGQLIDRAGTLIELKQKRLPAWQTLERLMAHAAGLETAQEPLSEAAAIRDNRLLLEREDYLSGPKARLADCLRQRVDELYGRHLDTVERAIADLAEQPQWQQLTAEQQDEILRTVRLIRPEKPDVGSEDALLANLPRYQAETVEAEISAVPERARKALESAARKLEPTVRPLKLERETLRTQEEVDDWVERTRRRLAEEIAQGPVLVQ